MYRLLALVPLILLGAASPAPQEKRFMLTAFERMRVDGPYRVEVVRSPAMGAVALGDRAAIERVSVRVDGTTLVVAPAGEAFRLRSGEGVRTASIRVSTPSLRSLMVNGGGQVQVQELRGARVDLGLNGAGSIQVGRVEADELNVSLTGSGTVTIAGKARRGRLRSSGSGMLAAGGLMMDEATLVNDASGETEVSVRYTARVSALGLGRVRILGRPECTVSGAGPVECAGRLVRR